MAKNSELPIKSKVKQKEQENENGSDKITNDKIRSVKYSTYAEEIQYRAIRNSILAFSVENLQQLRNHSKSFLH